MRSLRLREAYLLRRYLEDRLSESNRPHSFHVGSFPELGMLESEFPRRTLLGSSVNRGKRKGRSPGTYLGLPATVEATRVVTSPS